MKTGVRSKLWANIFKKASVSMICQKKNIQNADNKQRELMICGEVTICFGEKISVSLGFIHQFQVSF